MLNKTKYIRDGRAPIPKRRITSKIMSSIRAKNTAPEMKLRHALNSLGIKGYKLHLKSLPGKPDICFPTKKIALFVNGCYWHRCPKCSPSTPKTHMQFWNNKFKQNKIRDKKKIKALKNLGWRSIVIWECEIKKAPSLIALKIKKEIKSE